MLMVVMVFESGLITKKVPRRIVPKIRRLQARFMLRHRRRISEAEIIGKAVDEMKDKDLEEKHGRRYGLEDIFGIGTSKVKGDASKDVDQVVYGV